MPTAADDLTALATQLKAAVDALPAPAREAAAELLAAATATVTSLESGSNLIIVRGGIVDSDPILPVVYLDWSDDEAGRRAEAEDAIPTLPQYGWDETADLLREQYHLDAQDPSAMS